MKAITDFWFSQTGGVTLVPLVALLLAALCTLWIVLDSRRRMVAASTWKVLGAVGLILILVSAAITVVPDLLKRFTQSSDALALAGVGGLLISVVGLIGYAATPGQPILSPTPPYPETMPQPVPQSVPVEMPFAPMPTTPMEAVSMQPAGGVFQEPSVAESTVILRKKPSVLAWLVIRGGPRDGKEFRLGLSNKLGRDAQMCEIVIDDSAISKLHASIKLVEDEREFYVTDLDSSNGTFVNSEQIVRHKLSNGDVVKTGETTLVFMKLEDKPPAKPSGQQEA